VVRSEAGDPQFAGFSNHATTEFADTRLQADQLPNALFESAEFLVLGTLGLAYPDSRGAIARALDLADEYYVKIFIDINWRPVFWTDPTIAPDLIWEFIQYADFLKLSNDEAEWLFGTTDPEVIAHRLGSVEGVLVTAGEKGCTYSLAEHGGIIPAFTMNVKDTTGAGDSFVAGFIHQLCQHGLAGINNPEIAREMVRYASAVGALTTTKPGAIAAQPTAEEVEAFLQQCTPSH
jgi:fructokinase